MATVESEPPPPMEVGVDEAAPPTEDAPAADAALDAQSSEPLEAETSQSCREDPSPVRSPSEAVRQADDAEVDVDANVNVNVKVDVNVNVNVDPNPETAVVADEAADADVEPERESSPETRSATPPEATEPDNVDESPAPAPTPTVPPSPKDDKVEENESQRTENDDIGSVKINGDVIIENPNVESPVIGENDDSCKFVKNIVEDIKSETDTDEKTNITFESVEEKCSSDMSNEKKKNSSSKNQKENFVHMSADIIHMKDDNSGESENESAKTPDAEVNDKSGSIKRPIVDDISAEQCPTKKLCQEIQDTFPKHDTILSDYIASVSCSNEEEINKHTENLMGEIEVLRELANAKEIEWNHLIHLRKVKEEILLRLLRKKNVLSSEKMSYNLTDVNKDNLNKQILELNKIFVEDKNDEVSRIKQRHVPSMSNNAVQLNSSGLVMVPVSSSIYCQSNLNNSNFENHLNQNMYNNNRNIHSKPMMGAPSHRLPNFQPSDMNGQSARFNFQKGRQGIIKDVQSIIADHRQRHPETVPRRGRRMKSFLNAQIPTSRMSMASADPNANDLGVLFGNLDPNSHMSTIDAVALQQNAILSQAGALSNGLSFKDVLVQFANMTGQPQPNCLGSKLPPPPPYPEVTLHPVGTNQSAASTFASKMSQQQQQTNSLLHGILTKSQPRQDNRFSTFSPTLAKLLTAPEKNVTSNSCRPINSVNATNNFLHQKASSEITITAVQPIVSNSNSSTNQMQTEVVQLDDFEEMEPEEDSTDRPLVIDESARGDNNSVNKDVGNNSLELNESEVPECQGCRKREAQFVCAGCANQWYCSRECQVSAWDEHSEVCSG